MIICSCLLLLISWIYGVLTRPSALYEAKPEYNVQAFCRHSKKSHTKAQSQRKLTFKTSKTLAAQSGAHSDCD